MLIALLSLVPVLYNTLLQEFCQEEEVSVLSSSSHYSRECSLPFPPLQRPQLCNEIETGVSRKGSHCFLCKKVEWDYLEKAGPKMTNWKASSIFLYLNFFSFFLLRQKQRKSMFLPRSWKS